MSDSKIIDDGGHTPTPWHVDPKAAEESFFEDVNILRHDGLAVAVCVHNGDIMPPQPEANAAFIVEAVNAYEANQTEIERLRAALGECRSNICGYSLHGSYEQAHDAVVSLFNEVQRIDKAARAALSTEGA